MCMDAIVQARKYLCVCVKQSVSVVNSKYFGIPQLSPKLCIVNFVSIFSNLFCFSNVMSTANFSSAFHSYKIMWAISNYCNIVTLLFVCQDIKTHYLKQEVHHYLSSPLSPSTSEQPSFCPPLLPNFQHTCTSQVESDNNVEKKIVSNHKSAMSTDQKDTICDTHHLTMSPVSVCFTYLSVCVCVLCVVCVCVCVCVAW